MNRYHNLTLIRIGRSKLHSKRKILGIHRILLEGKIRRILQWEKKGKMKLFGS